VLEAGCLAVRGGLVEVAEAVRAAPQPSQSAGGKDLLLNGLAVLLTEGNAVGMPMLRRALTAFRDEVLTDDGFQWLSLACSVSGDIWDDESWYALSTRLIEHARQAGALAMLPAALLMGAPIRLLAGEQAMAVSMTEEAEVVGRATANPAGPPNVPGGSSWPRARPSASARTRRPGNSPDRKRRSPGLPVRGIRTRRSVPSCS
jgi:hypothetical protein